ncbi:MAG TPA: methylenetetrahydrofolate reductase [Streptosporangiaceae bacterium]|nr:methylenetetrahydrofolate reductase [Streptosporangiaceae bacterium]
MISASNPADAGWLGLRHALDAGRFAVTAEIGPPRGADADPIRRKATLLRGWVDAVNITDNQSATVRLSSWAGSLAVLDAGVEPIMQLTCRDRNRIALQSDLLSASAMGIPNVLLMTGDHPRFGDHAGAKPVFDLDSIQLLRAARTMRDEGKLMSGRRVNPPPSWLLGAVESPAVPAEASVARLAAKISAGAQFVQTQFVFDVPEFAAWLARVRDRGLHEQCQILAGVGPVASLRALSHLQGLPGVRIPGRVERRLRGVPASQVADEGRRLAAETIAQLAEIPGVAGVHVMAIGNEASIPGILRQAGLAAGRPPGAPSTPDGPVHAY